MPVRVVLQSWERRWLTCADHSVSPTQSPREDRQLVARSHALRQRRARALHVDLGVTRESERANALKAVLCMYELDLDAYIPFTIARASQVIPVQEGSTNEIVLQLILENDWLVSRLRCT